MLSDCAQAPSHMSSGVEADGQLHCELPFKLAAEMSSTEARLRIIPPPPKKGFFFFFFFSQSVLLSEC